MYKKGECNIKPFLTLDMVSEVMILFGDESLAFVISCWAPVFQDLLRPAKHGISSWGALK
jgi:hypothetical protein